MCDGLPKKHLARNPQHAARRWIGVATDSLIVDDEDTVKHVFEYRSESVIGSARSGVVGALIPPSDSEIQSKNQHAQSKAYKQGWNQGINKARRVDCGS